MKNIIVCSWCGSAFQHEEDNKMDICPDCMNHSADDVGFLDEQDIEILKEEK